MKECKATIEWELVGESFADNRYSRSHSWTFDGGVVVPASASPHIVPAPMSDASAVDPEEALVAAVSSCHMLSFLHVASRRGYVVESYRDEAAGVLEPNADRRMAVTVVTLRPLASFARDKTPTADQLRALHHEAHDVCFIANSVKCEVRCEPVV